MELDEFVQRGMKAQEDVDKILQESKAKRLAEKQYRERHKELHRGLDVLIADFFLNHPDRVPSSTTILELMAWSYYQTQ